MSSLARAKPDIRGYTHTQHFEPHRSRMSVQMRTERRCQMGGIRWGMSGVKRIESRTGV